MARVRTLLSAAAVLGAPLVGCVLFVPTGDTGETCRFNGDRSTSCGECIAAHCQEAVNTCCRDTTCSPSLEALDLCASGGACDGLSSPLAACVRTSCAICQPPDAGATPDAPVLQSSCSTLADGCSCSGAGTPNDVVCDTSTVTAAVCCADANYPAKNNLCTCHVFVCSAESSGGSCSLSVYDTGTHSWPGPGCCSGPSLCMCDPKFPECGSDQTPASTCSSLVAVCPTGQKRVNACSY